MQLNVLNDLAEAMKALDGKKDYTGYIYSMPDGIRIPTLQEHHIDAQDQTPLPIWRLEAYFKYPDGGDLETEEILQ